MTEQRIARHLVAKDGGWVVTVVEKGTGAEHARALMAALGQLLTMVVPAGRIGAHREVQRALLRLGIATTVGRGPVESDSDLTVAATLRRLASDIGSGKHLDRPALIETLHDAARRMEER